MAWKCLFTPLLGGFWGAFPPNDVSHRLNPQKDRPWAEPRHLSHKPRKSVAWFELGVWTRKKGQDRTRKSHKKVIFHLFVEKPHWSDVHENLCSGWCSRRNHVCQVLKWNFQGLRVYSGSNFLFFLLILNGPYNSAALLRCDVLVLSMLSQSVWGVVEWELDIWCSVIQPVINHYVSVLSMLSQSVCTSSLSLWCQRSDIYPHMPNPAWSMLSQSVCLRCTSSLSLWCQRSDGRVRDPQVSAARHSGWTAASSSSNPDPQVPGQQWHNHVVPDIYVGRHLSTVCTRNVIVVVSYNWISRSTQSHSQQ